MKGGETDVDELGGHMLNEKIQKQKDKCCVILRTGRIQNSSIHRDREKGGFQEKRGREEEMGGCRAEDTHV
jgi:hypothetical protein